MAHSHQHSHEKSQFVYGHHDSRYNVAEILKNYLLIQEHYTKDPCADCLSKHHNLVIAYAEEGLTLDNANLVRDLLEKALELSERHLGIILSCAVKGVCKVKKPEEMLRMIHEVRALRREMNNRIYGLDGDVAHDILAEHFHTQSRDHHDEDYSSDYGEEIDRAEYTVGMHE